DRGVDLSDVAAQRALQRDRKRLHEQDFLAQRAGRCPDLGAYETRSDQEQASRAAEGLTDGLAVPQRTEREHVLGVGDAGQAPWRAAQSEEQNVEGEVITVRQSEPQLGIRCTCKAC